MVSALHTLQKLPGNPSGEIVLVSNQPHIGAQRIAAERVASLPEHCLTPVTVRGCGNQASLDTPKSIFLAIDSVRKSIQLLNPSYHVTTNWVKPPELELFESTVAGEWKLYKPVPVERLI